MTKSYKSCPRLCSPKFSPGNVECTELLLIGVDHLILEILRRSNLMIYRTGTGNVCAESSEPWNWIVKLVDDKNVTEDAGSESRE